MDRLLSINFEQTLIIAQGTDGSILEVISGPLPRSRNFLRIFYYCGIGPFSVCVCILGGVAVAIFSFEFHVLYFPVSYELTVTLFNKT